MPPATNPDTSKYERMRADGADAIAVASAMKEDDLETITAVRILRGLFNLGVEQAKEATVMADGYTSLEAYQQTLVEPLKLTLKSLGDDLT